MKKLILILGPVIFINSYSCSQEQLVGFGSGFINENFFKGDNLAQNSFLTMGFNYEYVPGNAEFSVSTEIQYFLDPKWFLIPVLINYNPGYKIKFLVSGGFLPLVRLDKTEPNKTIDIGGLCRTGIEYRVTKTITLSSDFGFMFIPVRYYTFSHFGDKYTDATLERFQFINLGINYVINTQED